ncbi:hypothetical protein ACHAWC_006804 [Mediolabrus comicus]
MILRLSTFLAAMAGLGLVNAQQQQQQQQPQLQRSTEVDGDAANNNNSRMLLHRKKRSLQKKDQRKLQSSQCNTIIAIDAISEVYDDSQTGPDEEFLCELDYGVTLPIQGTKEQLDQLRAMLHDGTLVSYESTLEVLQEVVVAESMMDETTGEEVQQPPFASLLQGGSVSLPPGDVTIINNSSDNGGRRRLNYKTQYEGQIKVLAVKVTDKNGLAVDQNARTISDKIFGTYGDSITPKSGMNDCSFGKFVMTYDYDNVDDSKLSAPGVVEVTIDLDLVKATQSEIRAYTTAAVEKKLGVSLPGEFQHVLYITEDCYNPEGMGSCGWAAYAYVGSWMSLYKRDHFLKPGVVQHEVGHNLRFAHSGGLDGRTYTDHTGLMGNPLWGDNQGKMCFNAPKNYQLAKAYGAWYSKGPGTIMDWDSGEDGGTSFTATMVGVAEFNKIKDDNPIVIKLETGDKTDYFIEFNRAIGPTSQEKQAQDKVTLYSAGNNGLAYATSQLLSILGQGDTYKFSKWRGTKLDLTVSVLEINTNAVPGYARVKVVFGEEQAPKTPNPTNRPTPNPVQPTPNPPQPTPPQPTPPTPGSKCGDGICGNNETSESCPNDCTIVDIKPNASNGKSDTKTGGLMFTVESSQAISMASIGVEGAKDKESECSVYYKDGDYEGVELDEKAWNLAFEGDVDMKKGESTSITLDTTVPIAAGRKASLFVTCKNGLMVSSNTGNAGTRSADATVTVYDGINIKKAFNKMDKSNGRQNAPMSYYKSTNKRMIEESPIESDYLVSVDDDDEVV